MKKLLILSIILFCCLSKVSAQIIYSNGITSQQLDKFEEPIKVGNQSYDNFGIIYKQFK